MAGQPLSTLFWLSSGLETHMLSPHLDMSRYHVNLATDFDCNHMRMLCNSKDVRDVHDGYGQWPCYDGICHGALLAARVFPMSFAGIWASGLTIQHGHSHHMQTPEVDMYVMVITGMQSVYENGECIVKLGEQKRNNVRNFWPHDCWKVLFICEAA
ncbi:hypothetical protein Sango_1756400 [Sesamum angolense]|uniref:Uncharacterized protein n=1 Tax=Sesamum angolense TaxID=2727404 RepID=A0AAE2BPA8_9LAMI|nr:hypothetical protein Sango_1756400 [Sesamum angolense]